MAVDHSWHNKPRLFGNTTTASCSNPNERTKIFFPHVFTCFYHICQFSADHSPLSQLSTVKVYGTWCAKSSPQVQPGDIAHQPGPKAMATSGARKEKPPSWGWLWRFFYGCVYGFVGCLDGCCMSFGRFSSETMLAGWS